jgi:hypothetical protein
MAAVIAAIIAGAFAGGVALLREHRIQERQLLVAARVVDEVLNIAESGIDVSLSSNGWEPFRSMPTPELFSRSWEESRGDLAGHVDHREWNLLSYGVSAYKATHSTDFVGSPRDAEDLLLEVRHALSEARKELKPYVSQRFTVPRQIQRRRKRGGWAA